MTQDKIEDNQESKLKSNLNLITNFLNEFGKEYEIITWDSGEGVDIKVKEYDTETDKTYYQIISINESEYMKFEKQEIE